MKHIFKETIQHPCFLSSKMNLTCPSACLINILFSFYTYGQLCHISPKSMQIISLFCKCRQTYCYAPGSCPKMCITNLMFLFVYRDIFTSQSSILACNPISCASTFEGIFLTSISTTNPFFHCYKHVFRHQMFQFYNSFHPHKNVLLILCVSSILFCVRVRLSIV